MIKSQGIVLKTYFPYKQKLMVLDMRHGKIIVIPNRTTISYGAYISYQLQERTHGAFITDLNIIDLPLELAKEDILFIHQLLELCYYFIPLNTFAGGAFDVLAYLYIMPHLGKYPGIKKVLVFQLFNHLGLYPEGAEQVPHFSYLASTPIDKLIDQPIDLEIEKELDTWLTRCIAIHPCVEKFKTIQLLCRNIL